MLSAVQHKSNSFRGRNSKRLKLSSSFMLPCWQMVVGFSWPYSIDRLLCIESLGQTCKGEEEVMLSHPRSSRTPCHPPIIYGSFMCLTLAAGTSIASPRNHTQWTPWSWQAHGPKIEVCYELQSNMENPNDDQKKDSAFYQALTNIGDLAFRDVFLIACCTATVTSPVDQVLASTHGKRVTLPVASLEPPYNDSDGSSLPVFGKRLCHQSACERLRRPWKSPRVFAASLRRCRKCL